MFNNLQHKIPNSLLIPKKWIDSSINGLRKFFNNDLLLEIEKEFFIAPDRNITSVSHLDLLLLGSALNKLNDHDDNVAKIYIKQINALPNGFDKHERFRDILSEVIIAAKILRLNPIKIIPNYKTSIKSKNNNENKNIDIHFEIGSDKYNLEIKNFDIDNQPKMKEFRKTSMPVGTHTTFKSKHDKIIEDVNIQGGTKNTILKGYDKAKALKNNLNKAFIKFDNKANNIVYIGYTPIQHEKDIKATQYIINEYMLNKKDNLVDAVFFETQRFWDDLNNYYSCIMSADKQAVYHELNKALRIHIF